MNRSSHPASLETLPPPPRGRTGWPWTEAPRPVTITPDGIPPPRITIVTPSYNQGEFLEETIRSVLLQDYPDLQYVVIDGGSTDGSVGILRRYAAWLEHWVSEPDRGQAHAINKGFARSTGSIHGYLNSDDLYRPGALARVAADFRAVPSGLHAYPVVEIDGAGSWTERSAPVWRRRTPGVDTQNGSLVPWLVGDVYLHQPGTFWSAPWHGAVGGFDERYDFGFDHKFFVELLAEGVRLVCHDGDPAACFRFHSESKTVQSRRQATNPFSLELWRIARDLEPRLEASEREVVRRLRIQRTLGRVWKSLRSESRGAALRALLRIVADSPEVVGERFFWSTAAALAMRRSAARRSP